MKQVIFSEKAPSPLGPYSQAILNNDTLYVSGQIAIDQSTGNFVSDGIENETHQVMKNLGYVLEAAGMNYSNVVKCSIFVRDMNDFVQINNVYATYFDEATAPARETVQVARLPKDVGIEISCIAIK
ncbi:RidA family protein [Flammeovirga yaeyamensis]|uniref:RidA family protein n=1 Tax=Flammeovirga yaeyamensis TaxID=367791 RepID=A0AAX1N8R3_9BACT|nr:MULTISPECIES: RidA family protein [Flammeovirga]ANQ48671.1 RidA family protein [Flammeovirga sp. MY04]MBB3698753.1 2-iminobutanoate/2-iminopropanoate deaminase [Flammeovirga yaeyamensis]NMF37338.1 RidA family protein [Flammeovirga yaeyamensis]QWG03844.1 RidA family protein [Flammeovirga yaeyamensis]